MIIALFCITHTSASILEDNFKIWWKVSGDGTFLTINIEYNGQADWIGFGWKNRTAASAEDDIMKDASLWALFLDEEFDIDYAYGLSNGMPMWENFDRWDNLTSWSIDADGKWDIEFIIYTNIELYNNNGIQLLSSGVYTFLWAEGPLDDN